MTEPIIEFKDFSFKYNSQAEPTLKNINLDSLEENINSIQKAVGLVEEFTKEEEKEKKVVPKREIIEDIYNE